MRRFVLDEKDVGFVSEHLRCNGYSSKICENAVIATDDEDIEIKTILDDNDIKYTENNLSLGEILSEVAEQLNESAEEGNPFASVTLISGSCVEAYYTGAGNGFKDRLSVRLRKRDGYTYYMQCTRPCRIDEVHLLADYINKILDMEKVGA